MKRFLAVFTGTPAAMADWEKLPESERQQRQAQGIAEWHKWGTDHANSITEMGGPVSKTKRVTNEGISDTRNVEVAQQAVVEMESERLRGALLGAVSHDVRTPLTALIALAESMQGLPPPLSGAQAEAARAWWRRRATSTRW
jgi:signal transduction histidine kinase